MAKRTGSGRKGNAGAEDTTAAPRKPSQKRGDSASKVTPEVALDIFLSSCNLVSEMFGGTVGFINDPKGRSWVLLPVGIMFCKKCRRPFPSAKLVDLVCESCTVTESGGHSTGHSTVPGSHSTQPAEITVLNATNPSPG